QVAQPGEPVRLDHGDDAAVLIGAVQHLARGLEHRGDLDRMMAVIVDDAHAVHDAGCGETPLDPAEAGESGADGRIVHVQLARHGDGGQGVGDVVPASHGQVQVVDAVDLAVLDHHVEAGAVRPHADVLGPDHGLGIEAVGDQAAVI